METPRLARSLVLASFLGTALVGGAALDAAVPQEAEAGYDIDESYFYMSLSSYGSWVQNAQFGWVWYPTHRDRYWRPYTVGSWAWTDYGEWMWVSDEPFGWATYHYGRWFLDPFYGWVWLPGRVWAPAWVSWRDGGDYIGWSPLGPWGYWDSGRNCYRDWDRYGGGYYGGGYHDGDHHDGGYHDGDHHDGDHHDGDHGGGGHGDGGHGDGGHGDGDHDYDRGRRYHDNHDTWNFTRKRDFASDRVDRVVIDRQHLPEVYRKSRDLPPPSVQEEREGRGVTRAIDRSVIERAAGRPIRPVKVENADAPTVAGRRDASPDRVRVYRPKVSERKPDAKTPDKLGIAKVPDRATRPTPARGGTPGTTGRQPQPPGKERGDSGEPRKAVKPESPRTPARTEQPRGGGSGGQRSGKPDTGAYERPARKDELGGYERAPRKTDPEGYVRPDAGSGRGGSQQPSRVQQPSRTPQPSRVQEPSRSQQPSRVQQPSRSQPPSRVQQPTRSQPPSRVQQPTRSQPPSRVQQPSRGGSVAPRSPAPAPATQRAPSSYNRPASPSGGSSGGGVQGGGGSPQGRGTYSQPQGSRGGQPSGAGGVSHGGGGSHGGSPGGGTGGPRGH